ncbi:MAG TPA: cupin domain-containing protein [Acetobacteraceae bacterium]|nr:cupin domain-containing protein [Acetobacteraceae bacterium]
MTQVPPEQFRFADDGRIPNSALPLLLWRGAVAADPAAIERVFAAHGWGNGWRDGIFPFHHFHSNAHEVLGIARGEARVRFGGPGGQVVSVRAGDVVLIPAGVGHCNEGASADLLVVGAYPAGTSYDLRRGDPAEHAEVVRAIAVVPRPADDPLGRSDGIPACWSA